MSFDAAVATARLSAKNAAYEATASRDARDRAIAQAWAERPGGMTWHSLVDKINEGQPEKARISVGTARAAERAYRARVEIERAEVSG